MRVKIWSTGPMTARFAGTNEPDVREQHDQRGLSHVVTCAHVRSGNQQQPAAIVQRVSFAMNSSICSSTTGCRPASISISSASVNRGNE